MTAAVICALGEQLRREEGRRTAVSTAGELLEIGRRVRGPSRPRQALRRRDSRLQRVRRVVIDSPALVAILLDEPEAVLFAHAIAQHSVRLTSAVSALEINLVRGGRKGPGAIREFDLLLHLAGD
jgi:hypothetical protein